MGCLNVKDKYGSFQMILKYERQYSTHMESQMILKYERQHSTHMQEVSMFEYVNKGSQRVVNYYR